MVLINNIQSIVTYSWLIFDCHGRLHFMGFFHYHSLPYNRDPLPIIFGQIIMSVWPKKQNNATKLQIPFNFYFLLVSLFMISVINWAINANKKTFMTLTVLSHSKSSLNIWLNKLKNRSVCCKCILNAGR